MTPVPTPQRSISSDNEKEYELLLRFARRSLGHFNLGLIRCNSPRMRDALIKRLNGDLKADGVETLRLDFSNRVIRNLYDPLLDKWNAVPYELRGRLVASVAGLEGSAVFSPEPEKASDLLASLNVQRDLTARSFPFPLLIWLTDHAMDLLAKRAPDFKDFHSGQFSFRAEVRTEPEIQTESFKELLTGETARPLEESPLSPQTVWDRIEILEEKRNALERESESPGPAEKERLADLYRQLGEAFSDPAVADYPNYLQGIHYLEKALELIGESEPRSDKKADILNSLGIAYWRLSGLRDTEQNLARAIAAYEAALKISTEERYPVDFAMTQNNLGIAYSDLAGLRDTKRNLQLAIDAFQAALKITTEGRYPVDFAMTLNNLGTAYRDLAGLRDTKRNLQLAIVAYQAALKIRTEDRYPVQFAMSQNNLGNAYRDLAGLRDTERNLQLAIDAYQAALKITTEGRYPVDFAMTQNNLGNAYGDLAKLRDTEQNLARAIAAFEAALKITTEERYPVDFAMTQNNLGIAYRNLAELRDTEQNLARAISAFEAALKIYRREGHSNYQQKTSQNLRTAREELEKLQGSHQS